MTELEWERSIELPPMLEFLSQRLSGRKLQLFAVACCRQHWELFCPQPARQIVNSAERFADGIDTEAELDAHFGAPHGPIPTGLSQRAAGCAHAAAVHTARCRDARSWVHAAEAAEYVLNAVSIHRDHPSPHAEVFREPVTTFDQFVADWHDYGEDRAYVSDPHPEQHRQLALLHDIVDNPFRRAVIDPAWRTVDVLALARRAYQARDFSVMPILADALQDAGCDNDDILTHCRDTQLLHARGCWVIDLVVCHG